MNLLALLSLYAAVWKPIGPAEAKVNVIWGLEAKGSGFETRGRRLPISVTPEGIRFPVPGVTLLYAGSGMNPQIELQDALPGVINRFRGPDREWVRVARRYQTARLTGVWPVTDTRFIDSPTDAPTLKVSGPNLDQLCLGQPCAWVPGTCLVPGAWDIHDR